MVPIIIMLTSGTCCQAGRREGYCRQVTAEQGSSEGRHNCDTCTTDLLLPWAYFLSRIWSPLKRCCVQGIGFSKYSTETVTFYISIQKTVTEMCEIMRAQAVAAGSTNSAGSWIRHKLSLCQLCHFLEKLFWRASWSLHFVFFQR
jgi:hypothetical protein